MLPGSSSNIITDNIIVRLSNSPLCVWWKQGKKLIEQYYVGYTGPKKKVGYLILWTVCLSLIWLWIYDT